MAFEKDFICLLKIPEPAILEKQNEVYEFVLWGCFKELTLIVFPPRSVLNLKNNDKTCARGKHGGAEPWDERQGGNSGSDQEAQESNARSYKDACLVGPRSPVLDAPVFQGGSQNQAGRERDKTHESQCIQTLDRGRRWQLSTWSPVRSGAPLTSGGFVRMLQAHPTRWRAWWTPARWTLASDLSERHWESPQAPNNFHVTVCVLPLTAPLHKHTGPSIRNEPARLFNLVVVILLHTAQNIYLHFTRNVVMTMLNARSHFQLLR